MYVKRRLSHVACSRNAEEAASDALAGQCRFGKQHLHNSNLEV